jgi:acyl-CoA thioester hydrolase
MTRDDFRFFQPFRVRYSEIDAQGVVFNAHYLTYFDTSITEYFRSLGYDQLADAKATGVDFHVVKAVVEFKQPILLDKEIEVATRVGRIGNSSITFELMIVPKNENTELASGEIVWVNTDQRTHKTAPVPASLRELIASREKHLR